MASSFETASSQWVLSSQRAADLYSSGTKLWTKNDLRAIEQELAESYTRTSFVLRRFDGTTIHVNNPLYGVERPIWRPFVKFQEYWRLVRVKPDAPPETYHCSYLVDWENESQELFDGFIENYEAVLQQKRQLWNDSSTCTLFKTRIRQLLGTDTRKVSKVVCFGLGDMTRRPQPWWRFRNALSDKPETEASCWEDSMMQHCMALTLADVVRHHTAGTSVRLLTQDPKYSDKTARDLESIGFEVVGRFGAGGFAEVDDDCVVFSAFPMAPAKQIIADIARPALIVGRYSGENVGSSGKTMIDAESPRTRQMWQEYEVEDFPVAPDEVQVPSMEFLRRLGIFARTANPSGDRSDAAGSLRVLED